MKDTHELEALGPWLMLAAKQNIHNRSVYKCLELGHHVPLTPSQEQQADFQVVLTYRMEAIHFFPLPSFALLCHFWEVS